jgi:magnesium chelatase family protein
MGLAVLKSRGLAGMRAPPVTVEVHLANGLPQFTIVGSNTPKIRTLRNLQQFSLELTTSWQNWLGYGTL